MVSRLLLACLLFLSAMHPVEADFRTCPNSRTLVDAALEADFNSVCSMSKKVSDFLSQQDFVVPDKIEVTVTDENSTWHTNAYFGHFNPMNNQIEVMSYNACLNATRDRRVFGMPFNLDLHRSFIAHEITHAITLKNSEERGLSRIMHEYIAYSIQIATMPPSVRKGVLLSSSVEAFNTKAEMTETYLELNPELFAIKAYRHMKQSGNGNDIV